MEKILNHQKKTMVVYTALFGDYDFLIDPRMAYDGCDFICFTDRDTLQTNKIWKPIKTNKRFPSPVVANRHFKWLPHRYFQNYEFSLYLDSNIILYTDPIKLAEKYLSLADIAMPKHPFRNCLYDEMISCIFCNKLTLKQVFKQAVTYKRMGYPINNGLYEQGIILRKHNDKKLTACMLSLWNELERWGNFRDQIVFPYVKWTNNLTAVAMEENARSNTEFVYLVHKNQHNNVLKKILTAMQLRKRRVLDISILKLVLQFIR